MRHEKFPSMVDLQYIYAAIQESIEVTKPAHIYHYTSTEVLDKILANASFRASNIYYLNDSREYLEGLEQLEQIVRNGSDSLSSKKTMLECLDELKWQNRNDWAGLYTISFSDQRDNLQSWVTYAKESGICLELDVETLISKDLTDSDVSRLVLAQKSSAGEVVDTIASDICLNPVDYKNSQNLVILSNAFIKYYNNGALGCSASETVYDKEQTFWKSKKAKLKPFLQLAASFFKESSFNGEHELRLSFFSAAEELADDTVREVEIKYHCMRGGVLRPYIDIFFMGLPGRFRGCPIRSIMIGPSGRQQAVFDSVVHRIKYGKCFFWPFSKEKKCELLQEYLSACEAFSISCMREESVRQSEHVQKQILHQLKCFLAKEWAFRAEYTATVFSDGTVMLTEKESREPIMPSCIRGLVKKVFSSFYLSVDAVLVLKSTSPYTF